MPSKTTVKLNKTICERARRAAEVAGYSSLEEFIEHAIEKELPRHERPQSRDELARRLKGLGYLK
jgi:metal-responsive CopG/Arc/MetJ family transcriptional regulator